MIAQWNITPEIGFASVRAGKVDFTHTISYRDVGRSSWSRTDFTGVMSSPSVGITTEYSIPDSRFSLGGRASAVRRSTTYINNSGREVNGMFVNDRPIDSRLYFVDARAYLKYSIKLPVFWRVSLAAGPAMAWSQLEYTSLREQVYNNDALITENELSTTVYNTVIGGFMELSSDFRFSDRIGIRGAIGHAVYANSHVQHRNLSLTTGLTIYL